MARMINPINNYSVHVGIIGPFIGCLLFGSFYFLYKGSLKHFCLSAFLAIITFGFSWLLYPLFAPSIVRNMYREKGYIDA